MKSRFTPLFISLASFVALAFAVEKNLPLDPQVITGRLPNGLTYYIRSNAKPEKRVSLRLAVLAGSIHEEEDQRGMAHFVEHMGFNGTTHFPKNDLVHYLQSIGVAFGPEINAYTSFDRTVYMLDLPSDKGEILAKGFEIMADWAQGMTFASNEIAKERGVVVEEWRMRQGAEDRAMRQWLPVLYPHSRHADRWVIGTKESITGSPDAAIKRFYQNWYRADRMALVVVGDMSASEAVARLKKGMGPLKGGRLQKEPVVQSGPDNTNWAICRVEEPEFPHHSVTLGALLPVESTRTESDFRKQLARDLALSMLGSRLRELAQNAPPPFISHQVFCGSYGLGLRDVFVMGVDVAETNILSGLKILLTERRRVQLHGFTGSEMERAKKQALNQLTRRYEERAKTESPALANACVGHFALGEAMPGIEKEYELGKALLPTISSEEATREFLVLLKAPNPNVLLEIIKKPGVTAPGDAEIMSLVQHLSTEVVAPYSEKVLPTQLVGTAPKPGAIAQTRTLPQGITEIVFSNGVKVVLKPTPFKSNEILMSAWAPGGLSQVGDDQWPSVSQSPQIIGACGLGNFRRTDLEKILTGKTVSVNPVIDETSVGLRGSCSGEEITTMLELISLHLTSPRVDDTDFKTYLTRYREQLANAGRDPRTAFTDHLVRTLYRGHARTPWVLPNEEQISKISQEIAISGWKSLTADASAFTFFFVGSFSIEKWTPLLTTWLGSLPTQNLGRSWKDSGLRIPEGPASDTFAKGSDPKGMVMVFQEKPATWTAVDSHVAWALGNMVQRRLIDKVREDLGGVYTIGISTRLDRMPRPRAVLQLSFPCAPENAERLTKAALAELAKASTEQMTADDLQKEIEFEKRTFEKDDLQNGPWRARLQLAYTVEGGDLTRITNYQAYIHQVTPANLKRVAAFFNPDRVQVFNWVPEGTNSMKKP